MKSFSLFEDIGWPTDPLNTTTYGNEDVHLSFQRKSKEPSALYNIVDKWGSREEEAYSFIFPKVLLQDGDAVLIVFFLMLREIIEV